MKKYRKYFFGLITIVLVIGVFGLGIFVGQNVRPSIEKIEGLGNKQTGQAEDVDFSLFWDAWLLISRKYVDRSKLSPQEMVYGAIAGLVASLDDPHSIFMEPKTSEKFLDDISGSFSGIGAEIDMFEGILTIVAPLEGTPAQRAGIQPGDSILEVDGESTIDMTLDEAVNRIRGERGTEVILSIYREEWDETRDIGIVRDDIQIPIVKWEIKDGDILYVEMYHFTENLPEEFRNIIYNLGSFAPKGVVLDVRNNPGGYLEVAVDIASFFLQKGEVVAIEDFGENGDKNEFRSRGHMIFEDTPVVVLINEGSASASEILAGALRDIRGIQLVGAKSFGKGSVQQLEKLKGGSSIKITVAKWLTPAGVSIHEAGVIPDFEVEITKDDIENMDDPQLNKALELLNE